MREEGATSAYHLALLSLLLRHREHLLPLLSPETCSELRALARRLVAATALLNCAIRAAVRRGRAWLPRLPRGQSWRIEGPLTAR